MKRQTTFLLVFFFLFFGKYSNGQESNCECLPDGIAFTNQEQIDNFPQDYPGCTKILGRVRFGDYDYYGQFWYFTGNVDSLNHLTYIGELVFKEQSSFANFPNIDTLGGILLDEIFYGFSGLNNLKHIEGDFVGEIGPMSNFVGLEQLNSIGGNFNMYTIYDYELFEDFSGLDNLNYIGGNFSTERLIMSDFIGLENLDSVGEDLTINQNPNLTTLAGLENIQSIGGNLIIENNPNLSICSTSSICNHLLSGGTATIQNNAQGCDDEQEVLSFCGDIAYVEVHTFYDINQNQLQDSNEPNMASIVSVESQNATYYTGNDLLYFLPGSYTIMFDESTVPNWVLTTDSLSYFVNLEAYERDTISFGIFPDVLLSHLQTSVSSPPTRCNEFITFDVNTKNIGTTTADGTLWLEVDENILATDFIDMPDTTVAPNLYGWFFDDLFPSQSLTRQIDLQIPGPPDFPVGDYLFFDTYADFEDENGGQNSQIFTYEAEVRCSYDPNDKLVNPARQGDYTLFDENLIYTIRFQNTGNDVAYDVVIRDTLDTNLDLESFNVLGSSHPGKLQTSMTTDGMLTFEFRDIFLPDSTSNFEGSQGYVTYMINAIDDLAENTPITNSAGIYFDLNPPVLTNTTQSVMVSELPVVSINSRDELLDFTISPNPSTGMFHVKGIPQGTYQIHDTQGRIVQSGNIQNNLSINISQETQGVYFISIQIENEIITKRIIKM